MMKEGKGECGEKNARDPQPIPGCEGQREEGPEVSWEMPKDLICQYGGETSSWFHNPGHVPFSSSPGPFFSLLAFFLLFTSSWFSLISTWCDSFWTRTQLPKVTKQGPGSER